MTPNIRTPQEIFDIVATHLLAQGRKSMHGATCAYRSDDGCSCAIGCLIPAELYYPHMENGNIALPIFTHFRKYIGADTARDSPQTVVGARLITKLLQALRVIHDGMPPEDWKKSLKRCAREFKLTMPKVEIAA